jgi:hypothetical protein
MPISKNDFEQGRTPDTDEAVILRFLDVDREKAFEAVEIVKGINGIPKIDSWESGVLVFLGLFQMQRALNNLLKEGKIQANTVTDKYGLQKIYYKSSK